ncbi:MAG: pyruvate dehydrogenase (acetyl-transferring), homodimeric type [Buchnera aphidicola (Chaetogeoica yunlongensis)]
MIEYLSEDIDPLETHEWIESIESVISKEGLDRAVFIFTAVSKFLSKKGIKVITDNAGENYINTIPVELEPKYPGDLYIEYKIRSVIRWNAIMMVLRASKKNLELGGHLSSFQSAATIYEVCFNHFFRGVNEKDGGDLVYFQGHISPGIYSRAFIEGRFSEEQLDNFRQEIGGLGLSSYPHPKLMPKFWQFPTVSMGLSSVCAIYQAKFLKYLQHRNLQDTQNKKVYAFLGDGEMDEPESKGVISIAAREKLDNLIFIVNCNLQRLDGPVIGNGKVISELENVFKGCGWEVIKVIWGSKWDILFKKDVSGKLIELMNETLDGDYQTYKSKNGAYIRKHFFGKYIETRRLVEDMSDEQIWNLDRGGHDSKKIYAALKKANSVKEKPVIILMHTVKGYGMGDIAEGKNIAHQIKKIDINGLIHIKNRFKIPVKNHEIESLPYVSFDINSKEHRYLHERRKILGGYLPTRLSNFTNTIVLPELSDFNSLLEKQRKEISTTVVFIRILNILLRNTFIKNRIVPIVADEARTFGMEGLFQKIGIYSFNGQKYIPQDKELFSYYKEDKQGQILQEGINELGAAASWLAAATSYSTNNFPMIPFYIFYSIFGFQRIGDLFWAAGDQQARGFLIGGTSGKTTLNGEGLQHGDGHSHIQALTIPNCISYNPSYAYELAVIINDGLNRMYGSNQENIYYYITTMNESYLMPGMLDNINEGICKGIYRLKCFGKTNIKVQILGSGSILQCVLRASKILLKNYDIGSEVYSVTSFTELARNGQDCERWNLLHPTKEKKVPFISKSMSKLPAIAVTDYMKLFAEQVRAYVPSISYRVLGTDGFGRSDSRPKLRSYFEIDEHYIVLAVLGELSKLGSVDNNTIVNAINRFNIDIDKINPRLA